MKCSFAVRDGDFYSPPVFSASTDSAVFVSPQTMEIFVGLIQEGSSLEKLTDVKKELANADAKADLMQLRITLSDKINSVFVFDVFAQQYKFLLKQALGSFAGQRLSITAVVPFCFAKDFKSDNYKNYDKTVQFIRQAFMKAVELSAFKGTHVKDVVVEHEAHAGFVAG